MSCSCNLFCTGWYEGCLKYPFWPHDKMTDSPTLQTSLSITLPPNSVITGYAMSVRTGNTMYVRTGYAMAVTTGYAMAVTTGYNMSVLTGHAMSVITGYTMYGYFLSLHICPLKLPLSLMLSVPSVKFKKSRKVSMLRLWNRHDTDADI